MRKLYSCALAAAVALVALPTAAAAYKSVVVNHADGGTTKITMESGMTTKFDAGNLLLECDKGEIRLPVENLKNWTFSAENGLDNLWEDKTLSGIDAVGSDVVGLEQTGERLLLTNLPEKSKVMLVSMEGRVVAMATATGTCELSLAGLSKGVYVLTYNEKSVKIALTR